MSSEQYNDLTPGEHERLTILCEELSEVQQVICKIFRHGYEEGHPSGNTRNREDLEEELGHVMCAVAHMLHAGDVDAECIGDSTDEKSKRVTKYMHHCDFDDEEFVSVVAGYRLRKEGV